MFGASGFASHAHSEVKTGERSVWPRRLPVS